MPITHAHLPSLSISHSSAASFTSQYIFATSACVNKHLPKKDPKKESKEGKKNVKRLIFLVAFAYVWVYVSFAWLCEWTWIIAINWTACSLYNRRVIPFYLLFFKSFIFFFKFSASWIERAERFEWTAHRYSHFGLWFVRLS